MNESKRLAAPVQNTGLENMLICLAGDIGPEKEPPATGLGEFCLPRQCPPGHRGRDSRSCAVDVLPCHLERRVEVSCAPAMFRHVQMLFGKIFFVGSFI